MTAHKPSVWDWAVVGWAVFSVLIAASLSAIGDWNVFFVPPVLVAWLGVSVVLLAVLLLGKLWRSAGLFGILLAVVIVFAPIASGAGTQAWNWVNFKRSEATYIDIVRRADALPDSGQVGGVRYRIERGSTTRVAFPLPVGIADNWAAVIHDPSDGVATARGWGERPGDYTVRPELQELWGGDLLACSRIQGHYYRCDFT